MVKWFEEVDNSPSNVIYSRVRLVRNLAEYPFPVKLAPKESKEMIKRLEYGLQNMPCPDDKGYATAHLDQLGELDRQALRERRVFNQTIASKKTPASLLMSPSEAVSLVLNGDDHIRMQVLSPGLMLEQCYRTVDKLDDYVNERFTLSFDKKYGYLTTYPTNVGTGLRAAVVVHLPSLALSKKFPNLLENMTRFGAVVRGVYGQGSENYGALYEISNQKTLGLTEKEILDLVSKVAQQLAGQESQVRQKSLESHRLMREDEAYKSYGVLKYARKLSIKDSMTFLSQLMAGMADGLIKTSEPCSVYRLMLGLQPANLQKISSGPLGKEELDVERASFLRSALPELV